MKKISEELLQSLAVSCLMGGNPYIKEAIKFHVDMKPKYIWHGVVFQEEELNAEYVKVAKLDIKAGFKERMAGYYDKWYRYSRLDEGRAYDKGCSLAISDNDCPTEYHIIECNTI